MIATYLILKFKEKDKDKKWYNHIAPAILFGVLFFVYGFILSKIDANPLLNNSMTVFILSLIILFTSMNKRKWYINLVIALNFALLTFGIQQFFKDNLFTQKTDIVNEKEIERQKIAILKHYSIYEQMAIENNDKLMAQDIENNKMRPYFEEYMKFKETVCASKLDTDQKKIQLISYNSSNLKNVLSYADGLHESGRLLYKISNNLSSPTDNNSGASYKLTKQRYSVLEKYSNKIDDFVYSFDDCSSKDSLKSKNLLDEVIKADKPISEVQSAVMEIMLRD